MELEATWGRTTKVWWSYFWRNLIAIIASMILGAIIGGILGFVLGMLGASINTIQIICTPIGVIIGLLISIIPMKLILNKNFGEFRLVLIENTN